MFNQKKITASFTMAKGNFGGGGNALTLSGLRMSCDIHVGGGAALPILNNLTIYGMTLDHMNQLSRIGATYNNFPTNKITIQAGSDQEGMFTVFEGDILLAWVDGADQPNVRFNIYATPGATAARQPMKSTTRKGAANGEDLVSTLARQMGFRFENNGVHAVLRNPYLHGTGISQVRQCIEAMGCQWILDKGTLAIWPTGQARKSSVPLVSPDTDPKMVGYPQFDQPRIRVTQYFNPAIVPGGQVQIQSSLTSACGVWNIGEVDYELDCYMPHGRWFQTMMCYNPHGPGLPGGDQP